MSMALWFVLGAAGGAVCMAVGWLWGFQDGVNLALRSSRIDPGALAGIGGRKQ